ncbi:MAG: hypothetical protein JO242_22585, partial [Streptosporangiaceae bacterium]|nr:hypothetical protein [Streptosporangiaceae bacterium]
WGLLDPATTQDLVTAASHHPRTRWCVTAVGPDGTATAHGCAPGHHPYHPGMYQPDPHPSQPDPGTSRGAPGTPPPGPASLPPGGTPPPGGNRDGPAHPSGGTPGAAKAQQVADLLRHLNAHPAPIAKGTCDHRHYEDRYQVSRTLKHLIQARTARCTAPGCNRQAADWSGGAGAPCRDCSWWVSPALPPNPACAFQRTGLSTCLGRRVSYRVAAGAGCGVNGAGMLLPR